MDRASPSLDPERIPAALDGPRLTPEDALDGLQPGASSLTPQSSRTLPRRGGLGGAEKW